MAEHRFSAEKWNELLQVQDGEKIVRMLSPYFVRRPELRPPPEGLAATVEQALRDLGTGTAAVVSLSVGAIEGALRSLHEHLPPAIWEPTEEKVAQVTRACVGPDLAYFIQSTRPFLSVQSLLKGKAETLHFALWENLGDTPWSDFRECFSQMQWSVLMRDRVAENFRCLLYHQIAAVAIGREDITQASQILTQLLAFFQAGNLPIGRLEDGTYAGSFLVLTA